MTIKKFDKKTMYIKVLCHCFQQAPPLQLNGAGTSMLSEIQTADGDEAFIQVNKMQKIYCMF